MLSGLFTPANDAHEMAHSDSIYGDYNSSVPIKPGGSWWEDGLNALILTTQAKEAAKVGVAQAPYPQQTIIQASPQTGIITGSSSQGVQAGASVGNFADKAVSFLKQNYVIVGIGVAGYLLYTTTPKSRNGIRRNGAKRRKR